MVFCNKCYEKYDFAVVYLQQKTEDNEIKKKHYQH